MMKMNISPNIIYLVFLFNIFFAILKKQKKGKKPKYL